MHAMVRATKALSDETRLRILNLLTERECCVCEVMAILEISQTRASRNLNILYDAGFLKLRKEGLWAYYSIETNSLDPYLLFLLKGVRDGLQKENQSKLDLEKLVNLEKTRLLCGKNAKLPFGGKKRKQ